MGRQESSEDNRNCSFPARSREAMFTGYWELTGRCQRCLRSTGKRRKEVKLSRAKKGQVPQRQRKDRALVSYAQTGSGEFLVRRGWQRWGNMVTFQSWCEAGEGKVSSAPSFHNTRVQRAQRTGTLRKRVEFCTESSLLVSRLRTQCTAVSGGQVWGSYGNLQL